MKTKADKILYALEAAPEGMTAHELMTAVKHSALSELYKNIQVARTKAVRHKYIIHHVQGPRNGQLGRAPGRYVLEKYKR